MLLGAVGALALIETAIRPEISWSSPSLFVGLALMPTLLWRRSYPLAVVAVAFGVAAVVSALRLVGSADLPSLHTTAFVLLLVYSLLRWGAGREVLWGSGVIFSSAALGLLSTRSSLGDVIGASAVVLTAMALGAAARYRDRLRSQELQHARLRERERIARDLHDTIAHHVSAIAIRAQAGQVSAGSHLEPALDALRVIEGEASRALHEMRAMVRLLRDGDPAEMAPTPAIGDLARLAEVTGRGPQVDVHVAENVADLSPAVSSALYRLAQESITNARRHARNATRIEVHVSADGATVRLRVRDDGDNVGSRSPSAGYGLVGMSERAAMLGGTCEAGPAPDRGWMVTAVLPRNAS